MSGSVFFIVIIIIIAAIIFVVLAGKNQGNSSDRRGKITELKIDAAEKKQEVIREDPVVTAAKKDLYQYINQSVKKMFQVYKKEKWNSLTELGMPPETVMNQYDNILSTLNERNRGLIESLFACINLEESEEKKSGEIIDSKGLQDVFLGMMLPFYPVYYKELGAIRYSSLLNQRTLELFQRLTGKKFRMGYKNRYASGVNSFEWRGEFFRVYDEKGHLLCDARFKNGKVADGYAEIKAEELCTADWNVLRKGNWEDGNFIDGAIEYIYKKPCN